MVTKLDQMMDYVGSFLPHNKNEAFSLLANRLQELMDWHPEYSQLKFYGTTQTYIVGAIILIAAFNSKLGTNINKDHQYKGVL